jgi:uncharacterized protein (DUF362 family)/Pyruvate/2-oxoacid:ferredoxin oxidoreductase delta subunit
MPVFSSQVSFGRSPDYEPTNLTRAVESCLSALEPLPLSNGTRVLLKPNCLSASHGPNRPVNTRVEVIAAVGQYLRSRYQVNLIIADSGGMGSYGKTKRAYTLMGLDQMSTRLDAELVNLEELGLIEIENPVGKIYSRFKATALLNQIDVIINLPKLKTHILTGITGAIKNYLGLLPGSLKRTVHVTAPNGPAMSQALVDIWGGIKMKVPRTLNLMDGIMAMEGAGPTHGQARPVGRLMASTDPVALDVIASTIMGFNPAKVRTNILAAEAGLGIADPSRIELLGAGWTELPVLGFKHPFTRTREWAEAIIPAWLVGKAFDWLYEAKPRVRSESCQACGLCVQACPSQALSLSEQGLHLKQELCIECYCCLEHCPSEGLWVPRGLREKLLGGYFETPKITKSRD